MWATLRWHCGRVQKQQQGQQLCLHITQHLLQRQTVQQSCSTAGLFTYTLGEVELSEELQQQLHGAYPAICESQHGCVERKEKTMPFVIN